MVDRKHESCAFFYYFRLFVGGSRGIVADELKKPCAPIWRPAEALDPFANEGHFQRIYWLASGELITEETDPRTTLFFIPFANEYFALYGFST